MTSSKVLSTVLQVKDLRICDFEFRSEEMVLSILVKPHKNGCRCPVCGRRGRIIRSMKVRTWRDLVVAGWSVNFQYCPREIWCPKHRRVQERIPWARPLARSTHRLDFAILTYAKEMSQKMAAKLLHLPTSTMSDIICKLVNQAREGHVIGRITTLGIDEVSYAKGRKFATIVYDLDKCCVVWAGKGKKREVIDSFFTDVLTQEQRDNVLWASTDMCETYMNAVGRHCENATLVLDRFHVVKALGEAIDEVRKEEWRKASVAGRRVLKGLRWILRIRSDNRTEEQLQSIKQLRRSNRRIFRASTLKDEFDMIWTMKSERTATTHFKAWCKSALLSRLDPLKKFVCTMRKNFPHVVSYISSNGLSNAVAEGLNRLIKMGKNRASGFKSFEAFRSMMYLLVGDLNIADTIPREYRVL
jgi:transposase